MAVMDTTRSIYGVFAGGGVKGISLAGAAAAAMERGYRFERVVGTSSGALVASLIAAGYGPDDLRDGVLRIHWPELADPVPGARIPMVGKHLALMTHHGLNWGDRLEKTWRMLLRAKGVRRFADLPDGSLRMVTTDITRQQGVVLPDDLTMYGHRPDHFSVARAARMSSAAPFFYRPVPLTNLRRQEVAQMADGALAANFPMRIAQWDNRRPVVGFRFATTRNRHTPIRGPVSLATAVITSSIGSSGTLANPLLHQATVVEIDVDHDPLDFDVTPAQATGLFAVGYDTAGAFFDGIPGRRLREQIAAAG